MSLGELLSKHMFDIVSASVAVIAAVTSIVFSLRASRTQSEALEIERLHWRTGYLANMRAWGDQVCDALSEAISLGVLDPQRTEKPSFFERRVTLYSKLSSLLDRGRWFFPNDESTEEGSGRPKGSRGIRAKVLDPIERAVRLVHKLDYFDGTNNKPVQEQIVEQKKLFVAELQEILDPINKGENFEAFLRQASKKSAQFKTPW